MSDENHDQVRLQVRLSQGGVDGLADHELLALLLGTDQDRSAPLRAIELLENQGGLWALATRSVPELQDLPGLDSTTATRLVVALELGRRLALRAPPPQQPILRSADVAQWFRVQLQDRRQEGVWALLLDAQNRPITHLRLAEGSWTSCPFDPKIALAACLKHGAPALILIHNHPSGDPRPSRDDLALTERLRRAAGVMGLTLLDHLIVAREGVCSLADQGLL